VNARVPRGSCTDDVHAIRRKSRERFCADCGVRLWEGGLWAQLK
jgi:hypothetical protein